MPEEAAPPSRGLRMATRVLKLRCPRCGCGKLFRSFFLRAEQCEHCEWRYEREEGYWVGGSEVHMFASYGLSVVIFMPLLIILGPTPAVQAGAILGHIVCSLLMFRYSRSIFIGLDYFLDPGPPESGDGDGGGSEGMPGEPAPRAPRRAAKLPRRTPAPVVSAARAGREGSPRVHD
jgi:uncharacterized protein (DUF983 family)